MTTLTEKRITASLSPASRACCDVYDKVLPNGGDAQFWEDVDVIDGKLADYFRDNPKMGAQDVDRAFRAWIKRFTDLAEQARTRLAKGRP